jgi:serine/threonine-protein kinase PRP4
VSSKKFRQAREDEEEDLDTKNNVEDDFDMFNTSVSPPPITKKPTNGNLQAPSTTSSSQKHHKDDVDDVEGYYKAAIGEIMNLEVIPGASDENEAFNKTSNIQLKVLGVIGKGVFSSVLKCQTTSNSTSTNLPLEVAVKCIRSNETMAKAALQEMKYLIQLRSAPGVVPLLLPNVSAGNHQLSNNTPIRPPPPIDYRGHTLLVFPYQPYNLRDVLQKFGRGVGLSLTAVRSYFGQLLAAATHLQKHKIIHADIKPDNILVSGDFAHTFICDFGSAMDSVDGSGGNEMITPYLVSRFYRAPEIILGLPVTYQVDLWSLAVTAAELFLGNVLLNGKTNNDMLYQMMCLMGPFNSRQIRSHLLQTKKHPLPAHFLEKQASYMFRQETIDPVLGKPVHNEVSLAATDSQFKPSLQSKLLKARSPKDSRMEVLKFSDLLSKCLVLDPSKRITVKAALQHDFFKEKTSDNK